MGAGCAVRVRTDLLFGKRRTVVIGIVVRYMLVLVMTKVLASVSAFVHAICRCYRPAKLESNREDQHI